MAKIFSAPVPEPKIAIPYDHKEHMKSVREYIEKVREYAKANGNGEEAGEIIKFQVADGYAQYMVLSIKPLQLIHLSIGDAWQFQYANRLTVKDVKAEVARSKAFEKVFSK